MLSAIVLRERFSCWKVIGLAGGFAGALLVVTRGDFSAERPRPPVDDRRSADLHQHDQLGGLLGPRPRHHPQLGPRRATSGAMLFGAVMLDAVLRRAARLARAAAISRPPAGARCCSWPSVARRSAICSGTARWSASKSRAWPRCSTLEPLVTFAPRRCSSASASVAPSSQAELLVLVSVVIAQYAPARVRTSVLRRKHDSPFRLASPLLALRGSSPARTAPNQLDEDQAPRSRYAGRGRGIACRRHPRGRPARCASATKTSCSRSSIRRGPARIR